MIAPERGLVGTSGTHAPSGVRVVSGDVRHLFHRLGSVERRVVAARDEFLRLRDTVDSLGELALLERWKSAERALEEAIRALDDLVDPTHETSARGR